MPAHDTFERAVRRIERETGLHFSGARRGELPAAFARMAPEAGLAGAGALAAWLADGPWDAARTALCARHLTIGETYFFREPRGLDLLCEVARGRLAADPQAGLRVWSAGCATGEEPYTIALALRINVPQLAPERTAILATDLNPASLETARAGIYREWSFRRTAPVLRSAWFSRTEAGHYRLREEVRRQVRFAQLNLAQAPYPPETAAMDVIFCRNVLMYFSRSQMREAVARLRDCLVEGGWLVVNPSEASSELFAGFTPRFHPDAVLYRKDSTAKAAGVPAPARARLPDPRPA
ncbi:protein-glutamate O-methyltransferase CheR, partial [Massilia sp. ZL223]|uniref:CheR family methyltransferase n=1 Tax=Massilia sp. ZL223 TaxID=2824904 RepID=UPI001B832CE9